MAEFDEAYLRMQQLGGEMLSELADSKRVIDEIRSGKKPVLSGCPSRAAAIDRFFLSIIEQELEDLVAAMKAAREAIWQECGN